MATQMGGLSLQKQCVSPINRDNEFISIEH